MYHIINTTNTYVFVLQYDIYFKYKRLLINELKKKFKFNIFLNRIILNGELTYLILTNTIIIWLKSNFNNSNKFY
jgi:hypothetical protein